MPHARRLEFFSRANQVSNAFLPFRHSAAFFAPAFSVRLSPDFPFARNADSGSLI
jgi:hypothetical protein